MGAQGNEYAKWSEQQLKRAESRAERFLLDNDGPIWDNFRAKVDALDDLLMGLRHPRLTLDQRLDCFARIAEISRALEQDAQGFFNLASEPVVARLLANLGSKPR
jgi:exonuclease VII small subunit